MTAQNIINNDDKKPSACGTGCGASDDTKKEEPKKPTACGTGCGASDK